MEGAEKRVRKSRRVPNDEPVNCRCSCEPDLCKEEAVALFDLMIDMLNDSVNRLKSDIMESIFTPERILKSGNVTIVFWADGTKTIVKPEDGAKIDDYTAFTAALAKRIFTTNSKLKRVIKQNTVVQDLKKKERKDK